MRELITKQHNKPLNSLLHVHSTVFIVLFDNTGKEHNAALADHFANPFVSETVARVFDVVVTL